MKAGRFRSGAITVLLIDGNQQDRDCFTRRLRVYSPDYDVVQATSGKSGLDCCARQPIDCVILEIDLPDMSGFEVLAKLVPRVYRPEIAVIVLTGLTNPYLLELAIKNGAQAAFCKNMASGDKLDLAILKAISRVERKKPLKLEK